MLEISNSQVSIPNEAALGMKLNYISEKFDFQQLRYSVRNFIILHR